MKIDYCKGNAYFDTYYVRDENGNEIGLLEDHCRGVKQEYFVGWKKLAEAFQYVVDNHLTEIDDEGFAFEY